MKTPFVAVATRDISQEEHDRLTSPYQQQQDLLELLRICWDHNAAILKDHNHHVPTDWTGTPTTQVITEPDAIDAFHVIRACCDLWQAIRSKDPFAIAKAGIWLGRMESGDVFRQYQARNSNRPRSDHKAQAWELFQSRTTWRDAKDFLSALEKSGIPASLPQGRNWFTDFRKEVRKSQFAT
jgi:hypothetical protein